MSCYLLQYTSQFLFPDSFNAKPPSAPLLIPKADMDGSFNLTPDIQVWSGEGQELDLDFLSSLDI